MAGAKIGLHFYYGWLYFYFERGAPALEGCQVTSSEEAAGAGRNSQLTDLSKEAERKSPDVNKEEPLALKKIK